MILIYECPLRTISISIKRDVERQARPLAIAYVLLNDGGGLLAALWFLLRGASTAPVAPSMALRPLLRAILKPIKRGVERQARPLAIAYVLLKDGEGHFLSSALTCELDP